MKEAIAILTGGGPAPGMNTVVGSVAKTFLAKAIVLLVYTTAIRVFSTQIHVMRI